MRSSRVSRLRRSALNPAKNNSSSRNNCCQHERRSVASVVEEPSPPTLWRSPCVFAPPSRAFRTSLPGQNRSAGATAVSPRLNMSATCCGRGSHSHRENTRPPRRRHRGQTGSPAAFVNQVFNFEPAQREFVTLAETGQPLGRLRCGTALSRDAVLQNRPQQPRNAGVVARGFDPGPPGHVFFQGDGYIAQTTIG